MFICLFYQIFILPIFTLIVFKDVLTCFVFLYLRKYLFNVHPYGICKCKYCWLYFYFPCMFLHFVFVVFALAWYLYLLYALSGQSLFIFSTELCCHPSYTASQASSYWSSSSFWSSSFWSSSLSSSSSRSSSSVTVLVHCHENAHTINASRCVW